MISVSDFEVSAMGRARHAFGPAGHGIDISSQDGGAADTKGKCPTLTKVECLPG